MIRYSNYWRFIIWLIARVKYFIFAILISLLNFQFDSSLKNQILYVIYPTNNIFLYKHQNGERDLKLLYIKWGHILKKIGKHCSEGETNFINLRIQQI